MRSTSTIWLLVSSINVSSRPTLGFQSPVFQHNALVLRNKPARRQEPAIVVLFQHRRDTAGATKSPLSLHLANKRKENDTKESRRGTYNDDCFGLVFLCSFAIAKNVAFSGTFLVLSASAALATVQGRLPSSNEVPAAVAGLTLLVAPAVLAAFSSLVGTDHPSWSAWSNVALCIFSMLYGFVLKKNATEKCNIL